MVRQWLGSMIFSLIGLSAGIAAQADRDIVYAARYYAPPGSHRTSHFHLYRINPDGTGRTQLTFGNGDEERPHWSADGLRVRFVEDTESPWLQTLCEVNANGGRRRVLKKLTDRASPEDLHEDLQTPRYQSLTVGGAIAKWAPASGGNNPVHYANTVSAWTGLQVNTQMNTLGGAQTTSVANAIQRFEGWRVGTIRITTPP